MQIKTVKINFFKTLFIYAKITALVLLNNLPFFIIQVEEVQALGVILFN